MCIRDRPIIKDPEEKLLRALTELEEGEEWLVKPKALSKNNCWTPGIKINVQPNSWTHMNEWFGPVLGIMKAPNLKKAIEWQNATEYGLTAGLHSLSTKECNYWLKNVEAGNLYINRPITGAVVKRQPFGGWKKSSFGSTLKAGSSFYPSIFRRYDYVKDYDMLSNDLEELWNIKSNKIQNDNLQAEHNYSVLYPHKKVLIVQDDKSDLEFKEFLDSIKKIFGITIDEIEYSKLEDNDSMVKYTLCLLYTSPSPRDLSTSRMPSSA